MKRCLKYIVPLLAGVACFCFFQANLKFHFFFIEQNQLFLASGDYLAEFFEKPAWLSCMAGAFFQQFYHYTCGGAAVLTLWLLVFWFITFRSLAVIFGEKSRSGWRMLMGWILSLSFTVYAAGFYLYENAMLASLLSAAGGMTLWLICRRVRFRSEGWNCAVFILAGALCFWMFGYGTVLMIVLEVAERCVRRKVPTAALALTALMAVFSFPLSRSYRMEKKELLTYPGVGKRVGLEAAKYVERLLIYDNVYYRGDYGQLLGLYERESGPRTKEMNFLYAMSASQFGLLPDKLPYMKEPMLGTTIHMGGDSPLMLTRLMCELYYLLGDMTYAERICMHANNFSFNKRSARLIKRLVEINLVTEEYLVAEKYLRMLEKSFVYRQWAAEHTPGQWTDEVKKEVDRKRQFLNRDSTVRVGDDCRMILRGLLNSNRNNIIALDYLLCTDIITGQEEAFLQDYEAYGPRENSLYITGLTGGFQNRRVQ